MGRIHRDLCTRGKKLRFMVNKLVEIVLRGYGVSTEVRQSLEVLKFWTVGERSLRKIVGQLGYPQFLANPCDGGRLKHLLGHRGGRDRQTLNVEL